jgi:hypothetical protein
MKIKPIYTIAVIALILTLLVGCAPSATDDMESYINYEAGFGIKFPGPWDHQSPFDSPDSPQNQEIFSGSEGGVEISWGSGLGGACTTDTVQVELAEGKTTACYVKKGDGTEEWSQISHEEIGGNSFSIRAYTNDAQSSSHDLMLDVLSTLTFNIRRGSNP